MQHHKEHCQGKQLDDQIRDSFLALLAAVERLLQSAHVPGALRDLRHTLSAGAVLKGLVQPAQGIEHKAVELPKALPEGGARVGAASAVDQGDQPTVR